MPRGESIQVFCSRNKVPYNLYDKWYTGTLHKVVPVSITGKPREEEEAERRSNEAEARSAMLMAKVGELLSGPGKMQSDLSSLVRQLAERGRLV